MQVTVQHEPIQTFEADAIVVNLFQGVTLPGGATGAVDAALGGQISSVIGTGDFKGKLGEVLTLYPRRAIPSPRVIVVGLGKPEKFGLEEVRRAAASAAQAAHKLGVKHLATIVHGAGVGGLATRAAAEATVEGSLLALYAFDTYKSKSTADGSGGDGDASPAVERISIVEASDSQIAAIQAGVSAGEAVAAGVALARDLANHPSNVATPTYLAEQARALAARYNMRVEIWDEERIKQEGMGSLASVSAGSAEPAQFIVLEHAPTGSADQKPFVLAGKAVTFDTGGISLKPGLRMGAMKYDMSGGAAVLGAMEVVGRMALPLHIYGLVGATENMPSGTATKPGDIVTALTGTTIEVLNTDAEGRMVLADVLGYAQRLKPSAVVDLATLTGAIVIALGPHAAGLFSNDDDLAGAIADAGDRAGERVWRLPTWEVYGEMVKSDCADIKNVADTSPSPAGSIYGAKFLERFVDYPWVHLDIAATAWDVKDIPYIPKGATGFGVRLLVEWLRGQVR